MTACARTEPVERRLITMRRPAGQLGALGPVAAALIPPDGPYHVLVQLHLDTGPERAAGVVSAAGTASTYAR